jgi:hypothetical protein
VRRAAASRTSLLTWPAVTAFGALAVIVSAVTAVPGIALLTVIVTAPPARASATEALGRCHDPKDPWGILCRPAGGQGRSKPRPARASGGRPKTVVGIAVGPHGLVECQLPGSGDPDLSSGSMPIWVPYPCPAAAPPRHRTPHRTTRPAPSRPATPAKQPVPGSVPASAPVPALVSAPTAATPVARIPRPRPPLFQAAAPRLAAATYTPGKPVIPIAVLITVVLTPCVITVTARLGKLLGGR